jgi:uncharacterized protein
MEAVTNLNREKIQDHLRAYRDELDSLGVESLYLFGSVARLDANSKSDIDFMVTYRQGMKTFDHYMDLLFLLEDLFHIKIDLVTTESLSPSLKKYIGNESQILEV